MIKSAVREMADSVSGIDIRDSVVCPFVRSILSTMDDGSATDACANELTADFKSKQIQLPRLTLSSHYLPPSIDYNLIRYAAIVLPPGYDTRSQDMHVIVLSTWEQQSKDIHNIYLVMNHSEVLLIRNAVSRLISGRSLTGVVELHPLVTGRVMVSSCTLVHHLEKKTDCCSPQKLMSFILDHESLSLFEDSFSNKPTYDFRFYKEQGPRVIEIIFVSKDLSNIRLQQQTQIYFIRKNLGSRTDEEAYDKLRQMLVDGVNKPLHEEYFINPEKHEISVAATKRVSSPSIQRQLKLEWQLQESRRQRVDEQDLNVLWLRDLYTGEHIRRNIDEEMQLLWFTFEHDLRQCIDSGVVPDIDVASAGLDPSSHSHLQHAVEDIKDLLLKNDMLLALSHLQACLSIFKDTLLQRVSTLDQVELMKRIYFLSGRD